MMTAPNKSPQKTKPSWQRATLRSVGVSLLDCVHKTPKAIDSGFPYIAIPQLKNGNIDLSDARKISASDFEEWTRKAKPREFDVILSRRCNPGETAHVPKGLECALGQNLVLLRSDGKQVEPRFLRWLLRGPEWWEQVEQFLNVGAIFDSLKCADIPNFKLTIPPVAEQRRIADILGSLDDKIELNRRMNETLEAMARRLFKSWFVDFDPVHAKARLRRERPELSNAELSRLALPNMAPEIAELFPDGFEDSALGPIPKGWRTGTLGEVVEILDSKRVPLSSRQRNLRRGKFPYHGAASVMDYVDDYLFNGVHVLMGEDGSVITPQGKPVLQYVWGQFWVNNHAHVLKGVDSVSDEHIYLHLQNVDVAPFVTGAVQPKINQGNMIRIPFVLPSQEVCKTFSDRIKPLFEMLRHFTDDSIDLRKTRDRLLPKLLSGELSINTKVSDD